MATGIKIGAWVHTSGDSAYPSPGFDQQIEAAAQHGLSTLRSYSLDYAERAAPSLRRAGMSLLGGIHVDSQGLLDGWRSQLQLDTLASYHELGVPLEGICVGNELREGGDAPDRKRFTARLSFGLANLLDAYRDWLVKHGYTTPLTYAMEGIVLDPHGNFFEWLWPLVDACDLIGVNLYPMGGDAWFTYDAFEVSRRFLHEDLARRNRLAEFAFLLRRILEQLAQAGKPMILTETGFPSAVGYHIEGERTVVPHSDGAAYARVMEAFMSIIASANQDYSGAIRALYFYEWRDNYFHPKIWNIENSPIHTAFGLCDVTGQPKLDIRRLVALAAGQS